MTATATPSPAAAPAAAVPARVHPSPKQRRVDSDVMVSVYNRSPSTYTHELTKVEIDDEGEEKVTVLQKIVMPPGTRAEVPENIADIWKRVSQGMVILSEDVDRVAKERQGKLDAADEKIKSLEAKIAAFEARQAELEAAAAPKGPDAPAGGQDAPQEPKTNGGKSRKSADAPAGGQ